MDERWLPMDGFEDCYAISDHGRAMRTKKGDNTFVGRILKQHINSSGYPTIGPCKNGGQRPILIHRLVMASFIGPCPEGKQVNHIDGVKTNNHLENLEYVTQSENARHSFLLGLQSQRGENNSCSKLTEENVHEVRRLLAEGLTQRAIAERFNVTRGAIKGIAEGINWAYLKEEEEAEEQT